MDPATNTYVDQATVTNGEVTVLIRMRQSGDFVVTSRNRHDWLVTQLYLKGKNLRAVFQKARP